jgi:hypothetical protein
MPSRRNFSNNHRKSVVHNFADILLLQLAEMMECETKPPDIFHMDLVYAEIDDITLSEVCQAMENEHSALEGLNFMTLPQSVHFNEIKKIYYLFPNQWYATSQ